MSGGNTTRPSRHLLVKHHISSNGKQAVEEDIERSRSAQGTQASPIAKPVLQQQILGAHQRPSQLTVDTILRALIQWIVIAHIAL